MTTNTAALTEFPEDWASALVVVAHPDDIEYAGAAAVARWTSMGKDVRYLIASRGEAGLDGMSPDECGPLRVKEQIAAADEVGVSVVEFLDHPDGVIEYGLPLRRDIARAVRRHQPEMVLTGNWRERVVTGMYNMADHRVVGAAAVDSVRDAANRWVFPDLEEPPWSGVRYTAAYGSPGAQHAVETGDWFDAGLRALLAHRTYLDALSVDPADAEAMLRRFGRDVAARFDGRHGLELEIY